MLFFLNWIIDYHFRASGESWQDFINWPRGPGQSINQLVYRNPFMPVVAQKAKLFFQN